MSFFSRKKHHSASQLAAKDPPHPSQTPPQPQQQPQQNQPQQRAAYPWSTRLLLLLPPLVMPKPGIVPPTSPSPPPFPRYGHALPATATANGELYLFGGLVREAACNDLYLFSTSDLSATLVQTTGDIPSPRVGHASAVCSSVLIVWGGDTKTDPTSDPTEKQDDGLYLLNLVSKEWTKVSMNGPSPSGRYGHAVTMAGTKFFVFGGQVDGEFMDDLWYFDLNTLRTQTRWKLCQPSTADRPAQRTGHICVTYGDRIIVFGGTDGQHHYNDTWAYDVNTRRWTELQCIGYIPSPREGHAAAVVDDFIYVFGGRDVDGNDMGDLAAFKLSYQRWYIFQKMGPAPSARSGHAMASTGSRVFVLGGESFTPTKEDDHGIIHVLDTKHVTYPESNKVAPPSTNANQERDNLSQSQEENSSSNIAHLQQTVQELRIELDMSQRAANQQNDRLCEIIRSLRADLYTQEMRSKEEAVNVGETAQQGRRQLSESGYQKEDSINETIDSLRTILGARDEYSNNEIARHKQINQELRVQLAECQQIIRAHELKHHCESLYAQGRMYDVAESLIEIANIINKERVEKFIIDWLAVFMHQCVTTLERVGDEASNAEKRDEAVRAYSTALSLGPSNPNGVMMKWARMMLIRGSMHEALSAAAKFRAPRFVIYRLICDILEGDGRFTEAVECFRQMQNELQGDAGMQDARGQWELEFRRRCVEKLETLGDIARDSGKHGEAIEYYSNALLLGPTNVSDIQLKRSNEIIELDPSSHKGYEERHAALHRMGRYSEAFEAFTRMLSTLEQSPDPQVHELRRQYIDASFTIRQEVEQTIRHMPRVLIDTVTGRLYDKAQQAAAFEELPIFAELRSSMTTRLDHSRIRREVKKYYQYVMFSHRWEYGEPLFRKVQNISIYGLESSPPNIKLQKFCKLIRSLGFQWVWSDTCCIDKKDNVVLQESLVAMFTWYRGSSLTIVYLRGVRSHSQQPGALRKSIWNTRAWTYQEYVAAQTVQFYTEDWEPYLGLAMFNHKESPAIVTEMEQASGVSAQELAVLRPGLERVREKLFLASMRQTTLVEDTAYSLLGIFNVAIPVIYGEGDRAVGRLLEHILTGSGDVTILAWTGPAGSYNSCLPVDLTVYNPLVPPHVPRPIETAGMDTIVASLRSTLPDLSLAVTLYDHLNKLPSPSIAASRLRLAGILFPVTELIHILTSDTDSDTRIYRATTAALGDVEIKTTDDLSGMDDDFLFIHPWISPLLDQDFSRRTAGLDDATRALRLVARLRRPFGALLLRPLSRVQYRRVATDCLILVQVHEKTSLTELIDGIGTVDIQ